MSVYNNGLGQWFFKIKEVITPAGPYASRAEATAAQTEIKTSHEKPKNLTDRCLSWQVDYGTSR